MKKNDLTLKLEVTKLTREHNRCLDWHSSAVGGVRTEAVFCALCLSLLCTIMYQEALTWLFDYPEPINVALVGNLAAATLNFVVSYSMDNSSWFDQYWAMAPVPIALYYAFNEHSMWEIAGSRKILALVAVTVWAVRLFSLFFVRVERENDSGGTGLPCTIQLPSLLITILTSLGFPLALARIQASSPTEHNTKMLGTPSILLVSSTTASSLLSVATSLANPLLCNHIRYKQFRQQCGSFYWPASFLALHIVPALMLHWGCLPLYYVLSSPLTTHTTPLDWAAFIFTMGAIALEATADQQLLDFTKRKMKDHTLVRHTHERIIDFTGGADWHQREALFLTEPLFLRPQTICDVGLWSWSRHPNYFGEFSFWLGLYLMGLAAAGHDAVWTGVGAFSVLALFVGYSIPFMEKRMKRYEGWKDYVRHTHAFVPFPTIVQRV